MLAAAVPPQGRVWTFDPADRRRECAPLWQRWGVAQKVVSYARSGLDVPPDVGPVQFLFSDVGDAGQRPGDSTAHSGDYVLAEWEAWKPRLLPGCWLAWHDAVPGSSVLAALDELRRREDVTLVPLGTENGLALGHWPGSLWFEPWVAEAWQARQQELGEQRRAGTQ